MCARTAQNMPTEKTKKDRANQDNAVHREWSPDRRSWRREIKRQRRAALAIHDRVLARRCAARPVVGSAVGIAQPGAPRRESVVEGLNSAQVLTKCCD